MTCWGARVPRAEIAVCGLRGLGTARPMTHPSAALRRKIAAGAFAGLLLIGGVACSDEDNDGNTADEEIDEVEDKGRDAGNEVEEQVDEGAEEQDDK
jgi:hypothetical protein